MGDLIDKGWVKMGRGGNYILSVVIGMRNRALIGINQVCCKSPRRRKAPIRFITDLVPPPISSVNAYVFMSSNANRVWLIRIT